MSDEFYEILDNIRRIYDVLYNAQSTVSMNCCLLYILRKHLIRCPGHLLEDLRTNKGSLDVTQ